MLLCFYGEALILGQLAAGELSYHRLEVSVYNERRFHQLVEVFERQLVFSLFGHFCPCWTFPINAMASCMILIANVIFRVNNLTINSL